MRTWSYYSKGSEKTVISVLFSISLLFIWVTPSLSLSEIKREDLPPIEDEEKAAPPESTIPLPGEESRKPISGDDGPMDEPGDDAGDILQEPGHALPAGDNRPIPEVLYDLELLPAPVRRMRELIIEACQSGELEALRLLIGTGADVTRLAFGGIEGDPIEYLQQLSGDEGGQEILAILQEVLEAGYVHIKEEGSPEMYIWPYFFAVPIESLDNRQRVELFKLVTAGDYEDMKAYGSYIFYRTAISPEGRWLFFLAGD